MEPWLRGSSRYSASRRSGASCAFAIRREQNKDTRRTAARCAPRQHVLRAHAPPGGGGGAAEGRLEPAALAREQRAAQLAQVVEEAVPRGVGTLELRLGARGEGAVDVPRGGARGGAPR